MLDESGHGRSRGSHREAKTKIPRREVVKGLLAAGLTGVAAAAGGDGARNLTVNDLAAAEQMEGLSYTPAHRQQLLKSARETRDALTALRQAPAEGLEPAFHFDPRLPGVQIPRGRSHCRLSSGALPAYDGHIESLAFAPVVALARLMRARKITSLELTRLYLDRLKTYGPRLNCVITLTEELALQQASQADAEIAAGRCRGPLHGIPWGAKDLLATRGIATTWGAKPYEHQVFDHDATVTQRLAAAGAVLVAKLSMGELAQGDLWFGGRTRCPWNPAIGSSGSSAGPGSAVAAGLVGFAIGTETLGSIVSPSERNGVTGLRPTYGRVSRYGAMALCWTMDKIGPMCRGVEDCALVLHGIYGPDGLDSTVAEVPFSWNPHPSLKNLRIGYDKAAFDAVAKDPKRQPIYAAVLKTLRNLGMEPTPITLPADKLIGPMADLIITCESAASFARLTAEGKVDLLADQSDGGWPTTFRQGSLIPAPDYLQAMRQRSKLQKEMSDAVKSVDLYVTVPFVSTSLVVTNLTGHPTLVTRCGMLDRMPQSIEFTGSLYREDAVLRVAHAYEQATEWHTQWPDVDKLPLSPPPLKKEE